MNKSSRQASIFSRIIKGLILTLIFLGASSLVFLISKESRAKRPKLDAPDDDHVDGDVGVRRLLSLPASPSSAPSGDAAVALTTTKSVAVATGRSPGTGYTHMVPELARPDFTNEQRSTTATIKQPVPHAVMVDPITPLTGVMEVTNQTTSNTAIAFARAADGQSLFATWVPDDGAGYKKLYAKSISQYGEPLSSDIEIVSDGFWVNSYAAKTRPDGNLVLGYQKTAGGNVYPYVQIFTSALSAVDVAYQLSAAGIGYTEIDFAIFADYSGAAVWSEGNNVRWRKFNANGSPTGAIKTVYTRGTGPSLWGPAVRVLSDDSHLIFLFAQDTTGSANAGIYVQKVLADGTTSGSPIQLDTAYNYRVNGVTGGVSIAPLPGDKTAVTWASQTASGGVYNFWALEVDASGNIVVAKTPVSDDSFGAIYSPPKIDSFPDGNFVVSLEVFDGANDCFRVQYFSNDLQRIGDPETAVTYAYGSYFIFGAMVAFPNGVFACGWANGHLVDNVCIYELFDRFYATQNLKPAIENNSVPIKKDEKLVLTRQALWFEDPDGEDRDLVVHLSDPQHVTPLDCATDAPLTQYVQGDAEDGKVCLLDDNTYTNPALTAYAEDPDSFASDPVAVALTLYYDRHAPTICDIPDIRMQKWVKFSRNFTDCVNSVDGNPLSIQIEILGGEAWPNWLHYYPNTFVLSGTPTDIAHTLNFMLTAQDIVPAGVKNESSSESFRSVLETEASSESTPFDWLTFTKIVAGIAGSGVSICVCIGGGCITLNACGASHTISLVFGALSRQVKGYLDKKKTHKVNYFAHKVAKELGNPKAFRDFNSDSGKAFISVLCGPINLYDSMQQPFLDNNFVTKARVEIPDGQKSRDEMARVVATAIKTVVKGLEEGGPLTAALIKDHLDEIVAEYKRMLRSSVKYSVGFEFDGDHEKDTANLLGAPQGGDVEMQNMDGGGVSPEYVRPDSSYGGTGGVLEVTAFPQ